MLYLRRSTHTVQYLPVYSTYRPVVATVSDPGSNFSISAGNELRARAFHGSVRMSPKSYFVHHTQQLSKAAVVGEGASIRRRIDVIKQKACRAVAADAAASEGMGYTA